MGDRASEVERLVEVVTATAIDPDRLRLRRELARRGWHESDLARAANISPATVTAAVHGRCISARTLRKIAVALTQMPVIPELDALLGSALDKAVA